MSSLVDFGRIWEEGFKGGRKLFGLKEEKPQEPLKRKVFKAKYQLRKQIDKISFMINKLKERDEQLFTKLVDAIMNHDQLRAKVFASEIAEVRKLARSLYFTQVALEKLENRLDLFITLGDSASTIAPIVPILDMLKREVMRQVPEIGIEISKIYDDLENVVTETGLYDELTGDTILTSEARKILEEAKAIAEQNMKEEFPSINIQQEIGKSKLG
ncbi:hypothetical protein EYM_07920 [Ignicoccus islandicus DSM 13165]|uniref:Uncharacterized protein n=1 Tax=Ignicoccus islandicus DSM 13165 TaxID=940295 RepID=A0A0U2U7J3_9CREN|nr:Snf7 family protein [Ignicoccus islandicus]ALU12084.1 hypothetical protein EYM_07920 [Ignicoccus islandicus DSM 13165]